MDTEAVYQKPTEDEVKTLLVEKFPDVEVTGTETRRVFAKAPKEKVREVCAYIHDNLCFEHCSTVIGVDYVDHLTVVYHISNYWNGLMIELSVDVPSEDPHLDSVTCIWEGANW
ncbi:MAG: NADH-quinone oxidoreductase subunit C, partial [Thermoplasmata archaeon]|nr:NADH-quinone oxidoreductase subunit C [Thermoplasmata archaeon]